MRWGVLAGAFAAVGTVAVGVAVLELTMEAVWRHGEYPDMAKARAAGAVERGWIPAWVPDEARAIKEVHNTDSGMRWLAFQLDPGAVEALVATLDREGFRAVTVSSPTVSPVFRSRLGIVLPPERVQALRLRWKVPEGARYGEYVAIEPDLGQVLVWSQPL